MEKEVFPEIKIIDPLKTIRKIGSYLLDRLLPPFVPDNTGGGPMLDRDWPLESDGIGE